MKKNQQDYLMFLMAKLIKLEDKKPEYFEYLRDKINEYLGLDSIWAEHLEHLNAHIEFEKANKYIVEPGREVL